MKSENILRAARNSLLCFFMALGAGFLVACGGGGGSADVGGVTSQGFPVYLSDSAAEGVEYSGPNGNGLTGKGGVFSASEGVFEFSIGETTLGRVRLNSGWANSHVTPADFIGVDEQKVIDIARIMQGLDEDTQSAGISISQIARTDLRGDLFERTTEFPASAADLFPPERIYTIPTENVARDHFVATRKCLFSGVYDGDYRATVSSDPTREQLDEGRIYYAVEPFADRTTGVKFSNFSNVYPIPGEKNRGITTALSGPANVGVIGSTIALSDGNELSFVTPRVVTGIWKEGSDEGTSALTLAEGNPRATRRVVGVEKVEGGERALGLYVLDYFGNEGLPSGVFRGRYYDVTGNQNFALLLAIAGGASWPTDATPTMLTLIGTRDGGDNKLVATAITLSVTRNVNVNGNYKVNDNRRGDDNYGSFGGTGIGVSGAPGVISGTWCDISGAVGTASPVPLPRTPRAPSVIKVTPTQIDIAWNKVRGARSYKLYRSRILNGVYDPVGAEPYAEQIAEGFDLGYRDKDPSPSRSFAGVEFFYQLEACNSSGCSARSPAASSSRLTN